MSWLSTAQLPQPHDRERLAVAWTRWTEKAARPDAPEACALLDALFGNSPYLTETALQNPDFVTDLWRRGPDAALADIRSLLADTKQVARTDGTAQAIAATLRRLKRRASLLLLLLRRRRRRRRRRSAASGRCQRGLERAKHWSRRACCRRGA